MAIEFKMDRKVSRRSFASGALLGAAALAAPSLAMADAAPDTITGASVYVDPETQMEQEEIKALACDYLRGFPLATDANGNIIWSYREMYAIATCYNNHPGLSTVEFVLNPDTMCLLAMCEKGTEKCEHLKYNNEVVLYWYHQIGEEDYIIGDNDYFASWGVQFKGTAKLLTMDDPETMDMAGRYYASFLGLEIWESLPEEEKKQRVEMILGVNELIYVEPTEVNVTSLYWAFNVEGSRRPRFYDPESPFFGYSARQVYYPQGQ
mgnify:CR=1 FL=1